MKILLTILFVVGALFINASHIPVWLLGGPKPTYPKWKTYGVIGGLVWLLILVLVNTML